jgi:hypothetical protein
MNQRDCAMKRPYEDIPRQGEYKGPTIDEEPSTSVRASDPVLPHEKGKKDKGEDDASTEAPNRLRKPGVKGKE